MEKKEWLMQPKLASKIIELHEEHSLPVKIIVGEVIQGLQSLTFEYELIDYYLVAWLVNKGTQHYESLPAEEIMEDYD